MNFLTASSEGFGGSPAPSKSGLPQTKATKPRSIPIPANPKPYFHPYVSPKPPAINAPPNAPKFIPT